MVLRVFDPGMYTPEPTIDSKCAGPQQRKYRDTTGICLVHLRPLRVASVEFYVLGIQI